MVPHFRPEITESDIAAVTEGLQNGHLSSGEVVSLLEQRLSTRCDGAHVVAVSSGTAALYLALAALELERDAEIVIPSYTCNSLYAATAHAGLRAVCADVPEHGPSLTTPVVKDLVSSSTGAVIVPHTFGYLADVDAIDGLGLPVIEDCAHALGAKSPDGVAVGTGGRVGVFSFYATKLLPSGEGGACVTRDAELAGTLRRLRNCDEQAPDPRAFNFKMNDLCATLALSRLGRLDASLRRRAQIAQRYDVALAGFSYDRVVGAPPAVRFRYLLHVPGRTGEVIERAEAAGVTCRRPVFRPLHKSLGGFCPRTERLQDSLVSIPLYPCLQDGEVETVAAALLRILG